MPLLHPCLHWFGIDGLTFGPPGFVHGVLGSHFGLLGLHLWFLCCEEEQGEENRETNEQTKLSRVLPRSIVCDDWFVFTTDDSAGRGEGPRDVEVHTFVVQ